MCYAILLILLLNLTLFHYDSRLLRRLLLLFGFYWSDYILFVCTNITSTRFNWVRRVCSTFWWVDHIHCIILRLLLIISATWVWDHNGSSLFWCAFVTFALLWELWFALLLLLLYYISRFWVIFGGSSALFAEDLPWSVDSNIFVGVFVTWVNILHLLFIKNDVGLLSCHEISAYVETSFCLEELFAWVQGDYIVLESGRDLKPLTMHPLHHLHKPEMEDFHACWCSRCLVARYD